MIKEFITKILVWEVRAAITRHRPDIIAITGSAGKSSTKEAVALVLGRKFQAEYAIFMSDNSF